MFGHILNQQIYLRHVKVTPNMWRTVEKISGNIQRENLVKRERFLKEYVAIIISTSKYMSEARALFVLASSDQG